MTDRGIEIGHTHFSPIANNTTTMSATQPSLMSATSQLSGVCDSSKSDPKSTFIDRFKMLYQNVNEDETPLPRSWSSQDKCNSIGLTKNNLRVHYKGVGKSHNDAASVRTAHPIPATCGLYYFEVTIISKGRDGYMGIGLTAQNFKVNRLPGWDKQSYGYHGDDGNSFSSSGAGKPYGPTFTTGDIIGCGVNLVDNTCFYTKNGINLGTAFRDLPLKLYPTVGLQTPGEVVDANFGQEPFKFDIEDMHLELRLSTKEVIQNFPIPHDQGDMTTILQKLVQSYLVHHGYSATAETFSKTTGQTLNEEIVSIRNRQKILKMIMDGRMGCAIEQTIRLYPGLLENNENLMFMLKCRQFIEMVSGCDFDGTVSRTSPVQTSVIQSTKTYHNGSQPSSSNGSGLPFSADFAMIESRMEAGAKNSGNNTNSSSPSVTMQQPTVGLGAPRNAMISTHGTQLVTVSDYMNDIEMDANGHNSSSQHANGNCYKNGDGFINNTCIGDSFDGDEVMDVDHAVSANQFNITNNTSRSGSNSNSSGEILEGTENLNQYGNASNKANKSGVERMLEFGRELFQMSQRLEKEQGPNEANQKMLEDAFSLLAYSNPKTSPLGWQLCPSRRETVCAALNSAILESMKYAVRSPLATSISHGYDLLRLMARSSLGACAFVDDAIRYH